MLARASHATGRPITGCGCARWLHAFRMCSIVRISIATVAQIMCNPYACRHWVQTLNPLASGSSPGWPTREFLPDFGSARNERSEVQPHLQPLMWLHLVHCALPKQPRAIPARNGLPTRAALIPNTCGCLFRASSSCRARSSVATPPLRAQRHPSEPLASDESHRSDVASAHAATTSIRIRLRPALRRSARSRWWIRSHA